MTSVKTTNTSEAEDTAELIAEIQKAIVKVNDLIVHSEEAEYLVDLLPDATLKKFGKERVIEETDRVMKSVAEELSKKAKILWDLLVERYSNNPYLSHNEVEVRYCIDGNDKPGSLENVLLPTSSEPILVERMIEKIVQLNVPDDCMAYIRQSNRVYCAGAPMSVEPGMRHLTADEFIAQATRQPNAAEHEWLKHQTDPPCELVFDEEVPRKPASSEILFTEEMEKLA